MSAPQPDRLDDRIDAAWIWDRIARAVIFIGGISAIIFVVAIFVFMNFVVDVLYAWLDPRIRYS